MPGNYSLNGTGMMMTSGDEQQQAMELVQLALQHMWRGEVDAAIETYDRALNFATGEDVQELITIRKAEALIAAEREGPELAALPSVVMRRRSPRHVYLAAGMLMRRYVETEDRRKAIFYGEIACTAAGELGDDFARAAVMNHLGIALVADSQFSAAIKTLDEALAVLAPVEEPKAEVESVRAMILGNLGGAKVLSGRFAEGVEILEQVLTQMDEDYLVAEVSLDLCFGYLELGQYELAERYGRRGLELATIKRQIRNANHLLGETCIRLDRYDEADAYFDVVASYYPDFKNAKQLLVAVDLCSVVNWKA